MNTINKIAPTIKLGLSNPDLKVRVLCAILLANSSKEVNEDSNKISQIFLEALIDNNLSKKNADFALIYLGINGDLNVLKQMYSLLTMPDFKHDLSCFISICANKNFEKLKDAYNDLNKLDDGKEEYESTIKKLLGW